MTPYYEGDRVTLHHGSCLDVLAQLPDNSVDAVVTDPPYGLANTTPEKIAETVIRWANGERDFLPGGTGFMGNPWDSFVPPAAVWDDCLRVLKPGGHVLAFAGSRTVDLMTLGLRMGGFEIRDSIAWLYGSGFPKSLDVSKAIDKAAGAARDGTRVFAVEGGMGGGQAGWTTQRCLTCDRTRGSQAGNCQCPDTAPATDEARTWQGWGTALKPAFEPVVVARKPLAAGTVAGNVLAYGTGALNIDGCRIESGDDYHDLKVTQGGKAGGGFDVGSSDGTRSTTFRPAAGRWPANVVLDESQAAALDQQSGTRPGMSSQNMNTTKPKFQGGVNLSGSMAQPTGRIEGYNDTGGASRFFYVAREDEPCTRNVADADTEWTNTRTEERAGVEARTVDATSPRFMYAPKAPKSERPNIEGVAHPTVKPLALMRWLVRLVTPPGGTVLEPFSGSGTTIEAALLEGFNVIGIEREAEYLPLIEARIARALATDSDLFGGAA